MSDIVTLKSYFNYMPSEERKADARFALLITMLIRSSEGFTKKTRDSISFQDIIKIFDWTREVESPEELIKKGKKKPAGVTLEEWCKIRTRIRKLEELEQELGLKVV